VVLFERTMASGGGGEPDARIVGLLAQRFGLSVVVVELLLERWDLPAERGDARTEGLDVAGSAFTLAADGLEPGSRGAVTGNGKLERCDALDALAGFHVVDVALHPSFQQGKLLLFAAEALRGLRMGCARGDQALLGLAEVVDDLLTPGELQRAAQQLLGGAVDRLVGLALPHRHQLHERAADTGARHQTLPLARPQPVA
jgi:hypothetical protein